MKKRGMFSKILGINIVSMMISIMIMGSTLTVLMTNYVSRYSENYLYKNVETVIDMIEGNLPMDSVYSLINGVSKASGSYIIIYDKSSKVVVASENERFVNKTPVYINSEYTKNTLTGQKSSGIGNMGGLFSVTMFTLQMPIKGANNEVIGGVSMSRPIPEHQRMQYELFRILIIAMGGLSVIAIVLSYLLARSISVPIKKISDSTKEFAKGNFAVRVEESAENSSVAEISELAEAFNHMAQELEKAEEIKNTFISDVSHELRTPMTTIGGFVSGMLDGTIPEDRQKEYLKIVYGEINRLSRLVNTFLDITRLQSDKLTLNMTNFDINEVIRIVVIGLENKIEEKNIDVVLSLETEKCYVNANKDSITRVLTNLIDNAVKFTNQDGNITISVSQKGHEIITSVRNTGCGISEEQSSMIFKRFYKVDKSRSINKEGTGIGLYLVKNILQAHGKDISLNSVEGEYAEFIFPLNKAKQSQIKNIN